MRFLAPLALVALLGCRAEATGPVETPADYVRVIDGDTLEIRGEVVRISNIDAPELPPSAKCWSEAALGVVAADQLKAMIWSAKSLELHREGKDRYGRTLARVTYDGGTDAGDGLVNLALASRWTGKRWDWCGPANLYDPDGPGFLRGPEGNKPFNDWHRKRLELGYAAEFGFKP